MHDGVFLSLGVFQFFEDDCAAFFFYWQGIGMFCGSMRQLYTDSFRLLQIDNACQAYSFDVSIL